MDQQVERAYQKQAPVFENKKRVVGRKVKSAESRYVKNVGLGIKIPREVGENGTIVQRPSCATGPHYQCQWRQSRTAVGRAVVAGLGDSSF